MTPDVQTIQKDRMRYTKDKFSSTLVLLAIVLDCLYFVSIYQSDVGTYYYNWVIGVSIVYNLVFLLAAFLASESVKNRREGYSPVLIVLGLIQIGRVFWLPMQARSATTLVNGVELAVMTNGQFVYVSACLILSAVCCIVAAITSARNNKTLAEYMRTLENQAA